MQTILGAGLFGPVLTLIAWTLVMLIWLYATRIPAMQRAKIDVQKAANAGQKLELPPTVTRVADNYNHLHEQPTLFYALALTAQVAGAGDQTAIWLAWAYVALRIIHSLIQATVNIILVRFAIFNLSALALLALLVHTAMAVLPG
ncbi:MAG: MAPEG family protein [Alphaproteobacteria bacterium]|nr:MAPEG family protein [Alphaproteobacteria bacterium]